MILKLNRFLCMITALAACGLVTTGCGKHQDEAVRWQVEREKIELSKQLELKQFRLGKMSSHDFEDFQQLQKLTGQMAARLVSLRQLRESLHDEVAALEGQRMAFQKAVLQGQRQRALGKSFEVFKPASGREFRQVSVAAIDDVGVTIRHADGSARLHYADLDEGQRVMFGLEADAALAAEAKEAEKAVAYERWIDTCMTTAQAKQEKSLAAAERETLAAWRNRSLLVARQETASDTRALAQQATPVGNSSWNSFGYRSIYRVRPTNYHYYYYTTPYTNGGCHSVAQTPQIVVPKQHKSFADTTIPSIP